MKSEIIAIGHEILLGEIINTNTVFLSSLLANLGIEVCYHTSIGDNSSDITKILKKAVKRSDIIFITGGLGPTADDITREVVSEFCNVSLHIEETALNRIEEFFRIRNIPMAPINKTQAMIPEGAEYIPNETGQAAGFIMDYKGVKIIALPGIPSEMKHMFETSIYPRLSQQSSKNGFISTKLLNCFGIPESTLGERIHYFMERNRNPLVGTRVKQGVIAVRILARGKTKEQSLSLISETEKEIRDLLGNYIFAEGLDGLENSVYHLLKQSNSTLSVAESCTGGLISHKLTNVPGISSYFLEGIVSYSNNAKIKLLNVPEKLIEEYGAVSKEVAEAMAKGVRAISGSDFSLAVTGIAGPGGGTDEKPVGLVYISVAGPEYIITEKYNFSGSREDIKERATNTALNNLRLTIMKSS